MHLVVFVGTDLISIHPFLSSCCVLLFCPGLPVPLLVITLLEITWILNAKAGCGIDLPLAAHLVSKETTTTNIHIPSTRKFERMRERSF